MKRVINKPQKKHHSLYLVAIVALLLGLVAWTTYLSLNASFEGTDDQASSAIMALAPQHEPWFTSPFEPSEGLERMLFIAQGIVGALLVGFFLWKYGKSRAAR